MSERIVVDPITRIEGHLRVEVDIDEKGIIKEAYSSGTAVRGLELIVKDRDPRDVWAFIQRICGVCTSTHALASVRSVEAALDIKIPLAGHLVRNVMLEAQYMHDHVVHFYHLHALDWVDVISAASADPEATSKLAQSISPWSKSSPGYFKDIQDKVKKLVTSGQLGIFANGYWGHPAYKLPAEANLMAVAHYLEALDWQKEIVKVHTILGGKNPHPHFQVGGMATPIDINSDNAIHAEKLMHVSKLIDDGIKFINEVYIPDLLAIASFYKDATYGGGIQNFLSIGDFAPKDFNDVPSYRMPRGAILNGNLNDVLPVDPEDPSEIQEYIDNAWYTYDGKDGGKGKHPYDGETTFNYTGPKKEYKNLDTDKKYTWCKAPRWKGHPMEVGPLARMVVGYAAGKKDIQDIVNGTLEKLGLPISALFTVLGRTAARGLETKLIADWGREDMDALLKAIKNGQTTTFDSSKWDPSTWPKTAKGGGLIEAPRGFLGHWIVIEDGKTANYQAIVPTTWNASPKGVGENQIAPYEASLMGTPLADKEQPLEIIRVIHSFDPCLACAVHLTDLENKQTTEIKLG
ncbi:MAG: nickel-dependent hydrogenase large subunit [Bacillales bacterium]|nr:nickel-dependent hydrogenase large subunit [Bacillales bacterium]